LCSLLPKASISSMRWGISNALNCPVSNRAACARVQAKKSWAYSADVSGIAALLRGVVGLIPERAGAKGQHMQQRHDVFERRLHSGHLRVEALQALRQIGVGGV